MQVGDQHGIRKYCILFRAQQLSKNRACMEQLRSVQIAQEMHGEVTCVKQKAIYTYSFSLPIGMTAKARFILYIERVSLSPMLREDMSKRQCNEP